MATPMTDDEWREFVMVGARTGKLATTRRDGSPHVAPIWFVLDDGAFVFTCDASSVKAKAMRRDPRIELLVEDEAPPFSFVIARGAAELSTPAPDEMLPWTTRIAGRYMGPEQADSFGRRNAVVDELLVRLRPDKVVALAGIAE